MNLPKILITTGLLTFGAYAADAQAINASVAYSGVTESLYGVRTKQSTEIKGSPNLLDEFVPGVVTYENGVSEKSPSLNLDLTSDLVILKKDDVEYVFREPVKQLSLEIDGKKKFFRKYGKSYYEVVYDGNTKFLKKTVKNVLETSSYGSATPAKRYDDEIQLYIIGLDGAPLKIKNEKTLVEHLKSKEAEVKAYIKENSINLKRDADIIKLLSYYDSLTQTSK